MKFSWRRLSGCWEARCVKIWKALNTTGMWTKAHKLPAKQEDVHGWSRREWDPWCWREPQHTGSAAFHRNPRMGLVGKEIKAHLIPIRDSFHQTRLLHALSNLALDNFRDFWQLQLGFIHQDSSFSKLLVCWDIHFYGKKSLFCWEYTSQAEIELYWASNFSTFIVSGRRLTKIPDESATQMMPFPGRLLSSCCSHRGKIPKIVISKP